MAKIGVTHAESGLVRTQVVRTERVSPNVVRMTLGGGDLDRFEPLGFDQWVRLAIPHHDAVTLDGLPHRFGAGGFLRYLALPKATRPVIRNYTIRQTRHDPAEVDIDFVVHGDAGVAGPWVGNVAAGTPVAFIDQGCGWQETACDWHLLVADESGMPAVLGVLRDLPREARGVAVLELFDDADRQPTEAPPGIEVRWLTRERASAPGSAALAELASLTLPEGEPYAFVVGEQALASGARRHLVNERQVAKRQVTFSGYWRIGRASPS